MKVLLIFFVLKMYVKMFLTLSKEAGSSPLSAPKSGARLMRQCSDHIWPYADIVAALALPRSNVFFSGPLLAEAIKYYYEDIHG